MNILLVAPDSLIGLVQTSLHMPHRQALTYIRLREDFAVAKVDGVPWQGYFRTSDGQAGCVHHMIVLRGV